MCNELRFHLHFGGLCNIKIQSVIDNLVVIAFFVFLVLKKCQVNIRYDGVM